MVLCAGRIVTVPIIYDFYIGHMVIYAIYIPGRQFPLTLPFCLIIQQERPITVIIMFRLLVRNDKDSRIFPVKADFYILCCDSILLKQLGMGFCKSFLLPIKGSVIFVLFPVHPLVFSNGIVTVSAGHRIHHGKHGVAAALQKQGHLVTVHMADELKEVHPGIKHPNSLFPQQITSVCQDHMSLRQRDGRSKILIRRQQVSGQFFGPIPNPHISKAVNQGLSVLPRKPFKQFICLGILWCIRPDGSIKIIDKGVAFAADCLAGRHDAVHCHEGKLRLLVHVPGIIINRIPKGIACAVIGGDILQQTFHIAYNQVHRRPCHLLSLHHQLFHQVLAS